MLHHLEVLRTAVEACVEVEREDVLSQMELVEEVVLQVEWGGIGLLVVGKRACDVLVDIVPTRGEVDLVPEVLGVCIGQQGDVCLYVVLVALGMLARHIDHLLAALQVVGGLVEALCGEAIGMVGELDVQLVVVIELEGAANVGDAAAIEAHTLALQGCQGGLHVEELADAVVEPSWGLVPHHAPLIEASEAC